MAKSGDGNYYFIEGAAQLPAVFNSEMQGLMATTGHTVSLGLEPQGGAEVGDVLNDLERNSLGRLQLPNLIVDSPIQVVARLDVPACKSESDFCFVRLAWTDPKSGERHVIREALSLPAVGDEEFESMRPDPLVVEQVGILQVARIREQAIEEMRRGDMAAARTSVARAHQHVEAFMDFSPASVAEAEDLTALDRRLADEDLSSASKMAKFQNYNKRRSR